MKHHLSRWLPRLAALCGVGALLWLLILPPGTRLGLWGFRAAFGCLAYLVPLGGAAALLGLVGAWLARAEPAGRRLALCGLVAGGIAGGLPTALRRSARAVPPIHDISTDPAEAPLFVAVLPLRGEGSNPIEPPTAEEIQQIAAAYPELQPMMVQASVREATDAAEEALRHLGIEVVAAVPDEGRVEGTDTTLLWGFKDDVVVKARLLPTGMTRVDVRSVSRVGRGDVGKNAARIRSILAELWKRLGRDR